jgi:hypothetical protein
LGEIISEDGAGGFLPDRVIPPAQTSGEGDPALSAALELLQDFEPSETKRTPLPTHAKDEARKRGAKNVYLDTFSFQAPDFYQRHGYQVFGELADFPPGHRRCFFAKQL